MIFDRHANLKYKYGNRHLGARGYYVDTVGRNKKAINDRPNIRCEDLRIRKTLLNSIL